MSHEPTGIVAADQNGTIIAWAGHATDWFVHEAANMLGGSVDDLVPDEFRDAHCDGLRRAMAGGDRAPLR